jgi:hypothetical protein
MNRPPAWVTRKVGMSPSEGFGFYEAIGNSQLTPDANRNRMRADRWQPQRFLHGSISTFASLQPSLEKYLYSQQTVINFRY